MEILFDRRRKDKVENMLKNNKKGMEMVQVAILVAIAIGLGLIFKDKIGEFVTGTFDNLLKSKF